jgi:hypothetical protein
MQWRMCLAWLPDVMIVANSGNALDIVSDAGSMPPKFDLIIDATANNLVAAKIERNRWRSRGVWPPLLTVVVGHEAERGIGMLSPPGAIGAAMDILRQVLLQCGKERRLLDFVDDFLPEKKPIFVPEPGCSAPTYIGSSVDTSAIAALLLNGALAQLSRSASSARRNGQPQRPVGAQPGGSFVVVSRPPDELGSGYYRA